jgi:hypothetical protein
MIVLVTFVLTIVFSIGYLVGAKQSTKQLIDKIKKDGGYFDMEITGAVYPCRTSSVNNDTMEFNPPHFKDIPKWTSPSLVNDDTMGTIGTKPKTQTDYQREHTKISPCVGHELESQREIEKGDINFMHKWIREKSGK